MVCLSPDGVGGNGTDPWTMPGTTMPGPGYPPPAMLHGSSQYSQPGSYGMHHVRESMVRESMVRYESMVHLFDRELMWLTHYDEKNLQSYS